MRRPTRTDVEDRHSTMAQRCRRRVDTRGGLRTGPRFPGIYTVSTERYVSFATFYVRRAVAIVYGDIVMHWLGAVAALAHTRLTCNVYSYAHGSIGIIMFINIREHERSTETTVGG